MVNLCVSCLCVCLCLCVLSMIYGVRCCLVCVDVCVCDCVRMLLLFKMLVCVLLLMYCVVLYGLSLFSMLSVFVWFGFKCVCARCL